MTKESGRSHAGLSDQMRVGCLWEWGFERASEGVISANAAVATKAVRCPAMIAVGNGKGELRQVLTLCVHFECHCNAQQSDRHRAAGYRYTMSIRLG